MSNDDDLPADDLLIAYITEQPTPPKVKEVAKAFKLRPDQRAPLRKKLKKMAEEGILKPVEGRRLTGPGHLPPVTPLEVAGITDDGDAIAIPIEAHDGPAPQILIAHDARRKGRTVAKGDRVLARLTLIGPGQYDAKVIRKIDKHQQRLFGVVFKTRSGYGLEPAERSARFSLDLTAPDQKLPFKQGDMIEAEIVKSPGYGRKTARAVRNLGPAGDAGAFSALAVAEFNLPHVFPDAVINAADAAKPSKLDNREDLRDLPLVTIDGADARDFDDAVFAAPDPGGGYRMVVAIADVSHYVAPDSGLDREAQKRGNSVYLPDQVIPMLPEALSNGLCSLVPGEDRACLAVEMIIGPDGEKKQHRFMRGLMRSAARLTYDAIERYRLKLDSEPPCGLPRDLFTHLFAAYELRALVRKTRGALDLDLPEKRVEFDDNGAPAAIIKKSQSESQKLIEEFMILANVSAAETLEGAKAFCVFRAHEPPAPDKTDALREVVKGMGLNFAKGQVIRSRHFNDLLHQADKLDDPAAKLMVNDAVLRSQSQADYRTTNPGHFGLALRRYAHFTSPIRRYADVMVHRSILNQIGAERLALPEGEEAAGICVAISEAERRATSAERRTIDRYSAKLMEKQAGMIVEGKVTTITSFGAFVEIGESGAEGLLPLGKLPDDFFDVDTVAATIRGRKTGLTIKTGDLIDVMLLEVQPLKASITLAWADGGKIVTGRNRKKAHAKSRRGSRGGKAKKKTKGRKKR
jgi:ribonuclease R